MNLNIPINFLLTFCLSSLLFSSCTISYSFNKITDYDKYACSSDLYTAAQTKLHKGKYKEAIKDLETIDSYHLLGPCAQQIQIDLIYAYYKSSNLIPAQAIIDRFLKFNPTHQSVDSVLYISGLINMKLYSNAAPFIIVDKFNRNPEYMRAAFYNFKQLIQNYPNSRFVLDSNKRLIYLKDRLARYELSVVKYYSKVGAYIAVINRVNQMLLDFPDTLATKYALLYMEDAYRKLYLKDQANKVANIISLN